MSGIFGAIDISGRTDMEALLKTMSQRMSHFPWHQTSTWQEENGQIALGIHGIGIFNAEPQPLMSMDHTVVLVMKGEFYRVPRLIQALHDAGEDPHPDTPHSHLAIMAYQVWRESFVEHLDGAFSIAIWDRSRQCVVLANDRFSLYPTYYAVQPGRLVFAPEVHGVACAPFVPRRLNLTSAAEYVRFQHLLEDHTFHEDIHRFPYASVGRFDLRSGEWAVKRYWDWDRIPYSPEIGLGEAAEEAGRLLRNAVEERSSDHLRPGVFLSGGLDSRTILGLMKPREQPVVTATFGQKGSRDVHYAEQIASAMNSQHLWFEMRGGDWVLAHVDLHLKLTEGFHSWIHMHAIHMLPQLRAVMDYNLSGWDGGTVMMGVEYSQSSRPLWYYPIDDLALETALYHGFTRRFTWPGLTDAEERLVFEAENGRRLVGLAFDSFRKTLSSYSRFRRENRADYCYVNNFSHRMFGNMVVKQRAWVEVRAPFWDYELIDFIYRLRPEMRSNLSLYRTLITRETPNLARIPFDKQELLPTVEPIHYVHALSVRVRRRLGLFPRRHTLYADYENYLRHELRPWAESILFDTRTAERGLFNMDYVRSLMARHMSGREEWTIGKIAPLITLEMVLREYFD
jgi:asparagine synthase (glutamine-hydrolysing)